MKINIKVGDYVTVISGKDKKKIGRVLKVYPKTCEAIVEGVNLKKKTFKKDKEKEGGIKELEFPIRLEKLMFYDKEGKVRSRIGRRRNDSGKLQRYLLKTRKFI